jgi:predicted RNA-binding protein with PIN domain
LSLIIDGYNVIFAAVRHPLRYDSHECERLRTGLLERLERYRASTGEEITVVFDGGPSGAHLARLQRFGGLRVVFSDPESDADSEIKGLVRESTGGRDLRVVSDDRELLSCVKRFRARVSSAGELLARMERYEKRAGEEAGRAEPSFKFEGPAPYEVDDWVDVFGEVDEEDLDGE